MHVLSFEQRCRIERLEPRLLLASVPDGFSDAGFASGLSQATSMAFAPDGRLFVTQQTGAVRVIRNGQHLGAPFLTVSTDSAGERGLLGLAFDPQFATNRHVYIYYTVSTSPKHNRVSRFTAALNADGSIGDTAVPGSEQLIVQLDGLPTATNHNGGALHFGPDGKLYIAVGDASSGANAQTLSNRHGKMLRLNKDGTIPSDNPFFNTAAGANRAIWAMGLRNPFTFSFQPGTGRLFINDVGRVAFEEINDGLAGRNYGWPDTEGFFDPAQFPGYTNPIHAYPRGSGEGQGFAITGGTFYNPAIQQFPATYAGKYFFSDFGTGWIRTLDPAAGNATAHFAGDISAPVDLDVGPDGALYYLERGAGRVGRISFTASGGGMVDFESAAVGSILSGVFSDKGFRFSNLPGGGGTALEPLQVHGQPQGYASKVLSTTNWGRRINVVRENGAPFSLVSLDYAAGRWGEAGDLVLTGRFVGGSTQTRTASFSSKQLSRLVVNWNNLTSFDVNFAGGVNAAYGAIDNVNLGAGTGTEVRVDIEPAAIGSIPSGIYQQNGFVFANLPGRGGSTLEALQVHGQPQGYASKVLSTTNWGRRIDVTRSGGASFAIASLAYAAGRWGEAGDLIVTATFTNGTTQSRTASFTSKQLSTLSLSWQDVRTLSINFAGGTNDAYGAVDNFVFVL